MRYAVIIPAHNEAAFLPLMLDSLARQTVLPATAIVVDDHSSDLTAEIAKAYAERFRWVRAIVTTSESVHLPGSKVIRAFQKGLDALHEPVDLIAKLDADLILPENYFETLIEAFAADAKLGLAGGFAYIERKGEWVLENLTDKDHIRGALKTYRRGCFEQIGGLQPAMGWDTVDELLCRYYGWNIRSFENLRVKHLKPTGANYNKSARYKQGEAFYTLGYGFWITAIASAKLSVRKRKPLLFFDYIRGYLKARRSGAKMLVTPEQARFIRRYRWQKMREKLF